jgi:hypothetical protein
MFEVVVILHSRASKRQVLKGAKSHCILLTSPEFRGIYPIASYSHPRLAASKSTNLEIDMVVQHLLHLTLQVVDNPIQGM